MTGNPPSGGHQVETVLFPDGGSMPNNPALPVVLMPGAVPKGTGAAAIRRLMEANGWGGTWTYTVFDYHHYHPNAHEALVCASGWADILLGGPDGRLFRVTEGDAVVLPAGTGHRRMDASADFAMCGAYPPGQENYETVRASGPYPPDDTDRIARVPLPVTDPVHGAGGPLTKAWGFA